MRHPPAASPRTAPAPPPPPAPAVAERAERARAEGPKALPRCVKRPGGGRACGTPDSRLSRHFCSDRDWAAGPVTGRWRLPGRGPNPQARNRRRPGLSIPLGRLPGPGNSLPCPQRPGRPKPGLVTFPRRIPAMCRGLCRLQTALRSACELVHMEKLRQEWPDRDSNNPHPKSEVRGSQDS